MSNYKCELYKSFDIVNGSFKTHVSTCSGIHKPHMRMPHHRVHQSCTPGMWHAHARYNSISLCCMHVLPCDNTFHGVHANPTPLVGMPLCATCICNPHYFEYIGWVCIGGLRGYIVHDKWCEASSP